MSSKKSAKHVTSSSSSFSSSSSSLSSSSSSSSSSAIADLFGPNPSNPHSSSSSSIFGSVFGPSSMGRGRSDSRGHVKHGYPDNGAPLGKGENSKANYYQQQTDQSQPFCYTSSIYYGGQDEVYSPTATHSSETHFKKNDQDDDPNSASRGNWWQGSLYY